MSNGTISSSAIIDAKDTAHIEAGKPLSWETSTVASDIRLNGGSIKGGKQLALLADDNITAKTANFNTPDKLYAYAGKDLNLNADKDLSATTIHLKSDRTTHITGSSKTLTATKDISIQAGSANVSNTNLRTNTGNLAIQSTQGDIQLRTAKLNAGRNLDVSALQNNIVSDGLHASANEGHTSILAHSNVDLNNSSTTATNIQGKTAVNIGSVGTGRLKIDNTNLSSASGDIQLLASGEMIIGNGQQRNHYTAQNIHLNSNNGTLLIQNAQINSQKGALNIASKKELQLNNITATASGNIIITNHTGLSHLDDTRLTSGQHIVISGNHRILQNHQKPTRNHLKAAGVLSLNSRYWQPINNTILEAGAINLKSGSSISLYDTSQLKALSSDLLKSDTHLKTINGDINIEGKEDINIWERHNINAAGDLTIIGKRKLNLGGKGGNAGNPSAKVPTLSAKGETKLVGGELTISGANITSGKDLTLAAIQGKLNIAAVNNTFSNYIPTQKAAELNQKSKELEQQIAQLKRSSPKSKLISTLQEERDRLAFYIQAINKEVKGKKPKGSEYQQAKLSAQNIDLISAQRHRNQRIRYHCH